jgi:hypothetical protein
LEPKISATRSAGKRFQLLESGACLSPQPQLEGGREIRTVGDELVFQLGSLSL